MPAGAALAGAVGVHVLDHIPDHILGLRIVALAGGLHHSLNGRIAGLGDDGVLHSGKGLGQLLAVDGTVLVDDAGHIGPSGIAGHSAHQHTLAAGLVIGQMGGIILILGILGGAVLLRDGAVIAQEEPGPVRGGGTLGRVVEVLGGASRADGHSLAGTLLQGIFHAIYGNGVRDVQGLGIGAVAIVGPGGVDLALRISNHSLAVIQLEAGHSLLGHSLSGLILIAVGEVQSGRVLGLGIGGLGTILEGDLRIGLGIPLIGVRLDVELRNGDLILKGNDVRPRQIKDSPSIAVQIGAVQDHIGDLAGLDVSGAVLGIRIHIVAVDAAGQIRLAAGLPAVLGLNAQSVQDQGGHPMSIFDIFRRTGLAVVPEIISGDQVILAHGEGLVAAGGKDTDLDQADHHDHGHEDGQAAPGHPPQTALRFGLLLNSFRHSFHSPFNYEREIHGSWAGIAVSRGSPLALRPVLSGGLPFQ